MNNLKQFSTMDLLDLYIGRITNFSASMFSNDHTPTNDIRQELDWRFKLLEDERLPHIIMD